MSPLLVLAIGMAVVVGMILVLRVNAFLSLITAALLVSLLSPGLLPDRVARVAEAFGRTAGSIGIVIALAAVIGRCMMESGAADRIVRALQSAFGAERTPVALAASGYVLSIPVFFDTVFYLLIPLARSLYRRTGGHYLLSVMAISVGALATHTLVPPTPGPLIVAEQLGVDLGVMIPIGLVVAVTTGMAGLVFARALDRRMPVTMRPLGTGPEPEPLPDSRLPGLLWSALPIVLPVALISSDTAARSLARVEVSPGFWSRAAELTGLVGNANFALLLSAAVAVFVLWRQRRPGREALARSLEEALMSGGIIILITAAGGAFGAMLQAAGVGEALQGRFEAADVSGLLFLPVGFALASVLKVAQGSTTVAMIAASSMLGAMELPPELLGFHPVYLAAAVGCGGMAGSWMNDSGFWVYARMGGLTEAEALKSWTPAGVVMGLSGLLATLLLAALLPLR
jgi:GntP family gluconate:H+ symporter